MNRTSKSEVTNPAKRRKAKSLIALAAIAAVGIGLLSAAPATAQNHEETPYETFSQICGLAGGTPSRNWPATRLTCRFGDGSIIWCTPSGRRCGHTKAVTRRHRLAWHAAVISTGTATQQRHRSAW